MLFGCAQQPPNKGLQLTGRHRPPCGGARPRAGLERDSDRLGRRRRSFLGTLTGGRQLGTGPLGSGQEGELLRITDPGVDQAVSHPGILHNAPAKASLENETSLLQYATRSWISLKHRCFKPLEVESSEGVTHHT